MSSSLKQKTVSGVWWSSIERFSVQGMQFSLKSVKRLFSFGSKFLLSGLLETLCRHLYTIVIDKKILVQELEYYTRADQFDQFPSANFLWGKK